MAVDVPRYWPRPDSAPNSSVTPTVATFAPGAGPAESIARSPSMESTTIWCRTKVYGAVLTYEYECDRCHQTFEARQRISDPPLERCEKCGGPVRRLLAPPQFILKGEGFYVNDYPSESKKKALEAEKKAAASPTSEGSTPSSSSNSSSS